MSYGSYGNFNTSYSGYGPQYVSAFTQTQFGCYPTCFTCQYDPCQCQSVCFSCRVNPCKCPITCGSCGFDPCKCHKSCQSCRFDPCQCRKICQCTFCIKKMNFIICWNIDDDCCKGKAEQLLKSTIFKLDNLWKCNTICRREYVIRYGILINAVQRINHELKCFPFDRKYCDVILDHLCELSDYILESKCIDIFDICHIVKRFKKALICCREYQDKKSEKRCKRREEEYRRDRHW